MHVGGQWSLPLGTPPRWNLPQNYMEGGPGQNVVRWSGEGELGRRSGKCAHGDEAVSVAHRMPARQRELYTRERGMGTFEDETAGSTCLSCVYLGKLLRQQFSWAYMTVKGKAEAIFSRWNHQVGCAAGGELVCATLA